MTTTIAAPATDAETPEAHHLRLVPGLRRDQQNRAAAAKALRDARFPIIAARVLREYGCGKLVARFKGTERDSGWRGADKVIIDCGDITVRVPGAKFSDEPSIKRYHDEKEACEKRAGVLCSLMGPGAARSFGAYCRARYGRKPDVRTIAEAYTEWIGQQLENCTC